METPQQELEAKVIKATSCVEGEYDDNAEEYDNDEPLPDLEKDDMMARRTGLFSKKSGVVKTNQSFNQFLPRPGSVKYTINPPPAAKQPQNRPKLTEKPERVRYLPNWNEDNTVVLLICCN